MSEEPTFGIGHNYGSNTPQTLGYVPLDALHSLACVRVHVPKVMHLLPAKYIAAIQQNAPRECCHDVQNLDVEAWYSCDTEKAKGVPDIYKFYCASCDAVHARFCVGGNHPTDPSKKDMRPFWEIR